MTAVILPMMAETLPMMAETLPMMAETLPMTAETLPMTAEILLMRAFPFKETGMGIRYYQGGVRGSTLNPDKILLEPIEVIKT
jgi:hypothetical protein